MKPKVIVALGKPALRFFLGREAGIIRNRGHWISWHGIPVMPTFHPAYLLRQEGHAQVEAKWAVYYDLRAARIKRQLWLLDWVWKSGNVPDLTEMYAHGFWMRKELAEQNERTEMSRRYMIANLRLWMPKTSPKL